MWIATSTWLLFFAERSALEMTAIVENRDGHGPVYGFGSHGRLVRSGSNTWRAADQCAGQYQNISHHALSTTASAAMNHTIASERWKTRVV